MYTTYFKYIRNGKMHTQIFDSCDFRQAVTKLADIAAGNNLFSENEYENWTITTFYDGIAIFMLNDYMYS